MKGEFYIGWEDRSPPAIGRRIRFTAILLLLTGVALGIAFALAQRTIGVSVFEWGKIRDFTGILRSHPSPHLLVSRPGVRQGEDAFSRYHLVSPFKFGLDPALAAAFDGKRVKLKGTLIYRGDQTMIEVAENSIGPSEEAAAAPGSREYSPRSMEFEGANGPSPLPVNLGRQTLVGEIVDSKCYLGVMNPGALIPHRACAIRCISGGIPPVLLVRRPNGNPLYFLLVSREGRPVNKQILGLVAEPVRVTGEVERHGELLVLRADPAAYQRVK